MALQKGQQIGDHHVIIKEIGHGGMSTVYAARDTRLERDDAIKVMKQQYADDPMFAARFKQEAQSAASLKSPHIVEIYDWNEDNGEYYIVMELLDGADLKALIERKGAIDSKSVARIAAQVCSALSVAHANDIIHRDIKPNNIMILKDGSIKVMDFGIAKSKNSNLTTDNSVWGTANYVSPEQVQGKQLGPTSDIYSLGIVMYEAVTGQLPFKGEDAISVALKQINDLPEPPSSIVGVDPQLEDIILACMEKDPRDRYQTASELRSALLDYVKGIPPRNAPAAMSNTNRRPPVEDPSTFKPMPREEPREPEPQGNWFTNMSMGMKLGIVALIAIIIGGIFMVSTVMRQPDVPETTSVPSVVGESVDDAKKRIENSELKVGKIEEIWGTKDDKGKVIEQDPAGMKTVNKGSEVILRVSKGEKPVDKVVVPSIVGKTADAARAELEAAGLIANPTEAYSDSVDKNKVVSQAVKANEEVAAGTAVAYVVSLGQELIKVPDVTGTMRDKAMATLQNQGFNVVVETVTDEGTEGIVRNYTPEGAQVKGTTVTIYVTQKPEVKKATVPSVTGLTESAAISMLDSAGFAHTVSDRSFPAGVGVVNGTVVTFSPDGEQPVGTTVHIVIAQVEELPALDDDTPDTTSGGGNSPSSNGGNNNGSSSNGGSSSGGNATGGGNT